MTNPIATGQLGKMPHQIQNGLNNKMMTEYIFYATEGFTQAPDGEDIENCQLLGHAYGKDKFFLPHKFIE